MCIRDREKQRARMSTLHAHARALLLQKAPATPFLAGPIGPPPRPARARTRRLSGQEVLRAALVRPLPPTLAHPSLSLSLPLSLLSG
eukprot:13292110-Alexandrium_andersonii.AAC.1